jgi:hypothetical protein
VTLADVSIAATPVDPHDSDRATMAADLQRLLDAHALSPTPTERAALLLALSPTHAPQMKVSRLSAERPASHFPISCWTDT